MRQFPTSSVRLLFPGLHQIVGGRQAAFFDAPAGTQVPGPVLRDMLVHLQADNANTGGFFATSRRTDRCIERARKAMADFVGASSPDEIVFGPNMTTLTFRVAQAVGRVLGEGDEVVVTRLDHSANVSPWLELREKGVVVRSAGFEPGDCTLRMDEVEALIGPRTRLVAVGLASNAVGTLHPVAKITEMARAVGAWTFVDAVHYAPHGPIDVQELGCDFLVCSGYKFFGPHVGVLWGRRGLLSELPVQKVRPAPSTPPERWETGTLNHSALAGLTAAVDYLSDLTLLANEEEAQSAPVYTPLAPPVESRGARLSATEKPVQGHYFAGAELTGPPPLTLAGRRGRLLQSMRWLRDYEKDVSRWLIKGFNSIPGVRIWGISDSDRLDERVPTFGLTIEGKNSHEIAKALADKGIFCWSGDFYAPDVVETLGLEKQGGLLRIGAVHYTSQAEMEFLLQELEKLAKNEPD